MSATARSAAFPALGTTATVLVTEPGALSGARAVLEAELQGIDLACSRFRPDSDLSRVNAEAGRRVAVDPLFVEAVRVALCVAEATAGVVDPTVGGAMEALGYDSDFAAGPRAPVGAGCPAAGCDAIHVDRRAGTVAVAAGVVLDLGATAKALAADRAARAASAATGAGVLVNLGGDISVAGPTPAAGWSVALGDDHAATPGPDAPVVRIDSGGLATSSTTVRRWDGVHHIVDPATGWSARDVWRTVSVAAASCVDANAASTAAIVLGERAPAWLCAQHLPARLVRVDGAAMTLNGWPEETAP